jgi:hypothetical protein
MTLKIGSLCCDIIVLMENSNNILSDSLITNFNKQSHWGRVFPYGRYYTSSVGITSKPIMVRNLASASRQLITSS